MGWGYRTFLNETVGALLSLTKHVKASLEWDGTPVPCVLQSSDIAKELTVKREEG